MSQEAEAITGSRFAYACSLLKRGGVWNPSEWRSGEGEGEGLEEGRTRSVSHLARRSVH